MGVKKDAAPPLSDSFKDGWKLTTSGGLGGYSMPIAPCERGHITLSDGRAPGMIFVGLKGDYSQARARRIALTSDEALELAAMLVSAANVSNGVATEPEPVSPQHAVKIPQRDAKGRFL